jgi:hypothetical protein
MNLLRWGRGRSLVFMTRIVNNNQTGWHNHVCLCRQIPWKSVRAVVAKFFNLKRACAFCNQHKDVQISLILTAKAKIPYRMEPKFCWLPEFGYFRRKTVQKLCPYFTYLKDYSTLLNFNTTANVHSTKKKHMINTRIHYNSILC